MRPAWATASGSVRRPGPAGPAGDDVDVDEPAVPEDVAGDEDDLDAGDEDGAGPGREGATGGVAVVVVVVVVVVRAVAVSTLGTSGRATW
jgi:hypothetical protein